jgi:hypothetical protein
MADTTSALIVQRWLQPQGSFRSTDAVDPGPVLEGVTVEPGGRGSARGATMIASATTRASSATAVPRTMRTRVGGRGWRWGCLATIGRPPVNGSYTSPLSRHRQPGIGLWRRPGRRWPQRPGRPARCYQRMGVTVGGRAGSRQGHETPRIARRMLTGLARHWWAPAARWAPCYPMPACGGSRHGDGHACDGRRRSGRHAELRHRRTHWAVVGISAWYRARRGAAGERHCERNLVAGPSDPPWLIPA